MKTVIRAVVSLLLATAIVSACGCGNMSLGLGNFTFTGLHFSDFSGNCMDFTVVKWYENDNGIEVETKEAGSLFFSEGTYVLYDGACPVCNGEIGHVD